MSALILIKHSLPEIQPHLPASQWHLSTAGRERARRLALKLEAYGLQSILSSLEPKAVETAEILSDCLGIPAQAAAGLHEHVRPASTLFSQTAFEKAVAGFFRQPGTLVFGSETADQAHARFQNALMGIALAHPDLRVAVVAHGTVISLFVAHLCGIQPFPLWKQLGLPSFVVLDLQQKKLVQLESGNDLMNTP